ncbi:MAG: tRNA lysidine(34) synthetase TilS [Armatimonadota bacterium]|nr:tRNA lysidine(34) synthetase TilS [Armatimonadota bacterium]MDR7401353.1 tRNA lysidine(34) synthetase TilS [Armatimonadota bacterium]MDR7404481.1 tRNA lysidine(34) synthetase TilS [Armatimonadota bacterium]MDR7437468.1 tRNA lysidine(34) synthetase TilS [Armatimonadota bacterium]MDR7472367.1 tRNA lysidine(34) synthetase TilS [Armatimonadota bacterium]
MVPGADLVDKVERTVQAHRLLDPGDGVVVAVSGGPDSVALLHALAELAPRWGWRLHVAHLNHRLRPEAGDEAAFVREIATGLGLEATVEEADVRALAASEKRSLEDAGRRARYAFFARVAALAGYRRVATAHTRDDLVETMVMRLLQGAAWDEAGGIPIRRPLGPAAVVRPLLECTRQEVVAFLRLRGIAWRDDPSNRDLRYLRNRIRWEVLPVFDRQFPALREVLADLGHLTARVSAWLDDLAAEALAREAAPVPGGVRLPVAAFVRHAPPVRRRLLRLAVAQVTGTSASMTRVEESGAYDVALGRPGRQATGAGWVVRRAYEAVEVVAPPPPPDSREYRLPVPGRVTAEALGVEVRAEVVDREGVAHLETTPALAYLDAAAAGSELVVRPWRRGDRIVPLGLPGSRKVHDIYVDAKVPRWQRPRMPVVTDAAGRILWVVGHRVAEAARVTERSRQVVRLRVEPLRPA